METETYKFPAIVQSNKNRSFKIHWINEFPWLSYSHKFQGGLCRVCVLFGKDQGGRSQVQLGKLVEKPLSTYKKAKEDMKHHSDTEYHKRNVIASDNFIRIMKGSLPNIQEQLDRAITSRVASNREKLVPIVKTIMFCGHQNIPLRGHRDDGALPLDSENVDQSVAENQGNFRALLRFRIDAGDETLRNHLQSANVNATYISKTSQNELIECCGEIIQNKIVAAVNKSKFFSVLADETTDVSIAEQFSLCVRYFDTEKCAISEHFLGFQMVESCSGEALSEKILSFLTKLDLDIAFLRGQGYDGGANMSGRFKGVQARILKEQPLADYTHCSNHRLNLALNDSTKIVFIQNAVGTIKSVSNYLRESPHRCQVLKEKIQENLPQERAVKAKKLCDTRWVERHDGILHFLTILPATVEALDELSTTSTTAKASSDAQCLSGAISSFEFLITLKVLSQCLAITLPLSIQLQNVGMDLSTSITLVESAKSVLAKMRENSEHEFTKLFEETKELAGKMDVKIRLPRRANVQRNSNATDPNAFYRINIFIPYIDHLLSEMDYRFPQDSPISQLQKIIPKFYCSGDETKNNEDILIAAEKYASDLPSSLEALRGELRLWSDLWYSKSVKADTPMAAYEHASMLPNIKVLLHILCVLPVTTATVERSFSTLKRIKTYLRSTMGEERLTGLALLNINKEFETTPEEVVDNFAKKHSRKMRLDYI